MSRTPFDMLRACFNYDPRVYPELVEGRVFVQGACRLSSYPISFISFISLISYGTITDLIPSPFRNKSSAVLISSNGNFAVTSSAILIRPCRANSSTRG